MVSGGDLNEILDKGEKEGGRRRPRVHMEEFRDTLERNDLWDIRPTKGWFTWQKGEEVGTFVRERLDSFVATIPWLHDYGRCEVYLEFSLDSDHYFVWLDTEGPREVITRERDYFRFDPCWAEDEVCETKVKEAWGNDQDSVVGKIAKVKQKLRGWQIRKRREEVRRKYELQRKVETLMMQEMNEGNFQELGDAKKELKVILDREERYWRQRSRVQWLKAGDRNTAYFHARANGRRRKNWIREIKNVRDEMVYGTENVLEVAKEFFSTLYRSDGVYPASRILASVETCITPDMNAKLCAGFTAAEVLVYLW
ncbi:hypothetical protein V6N13_022999 [Hibiscus sabdariffa]